MVPEGLLRCHTTDATCHIAYTMLWGGCKEEAELWIMPFKSGVRWVHDTGSKRKVTRRTIEESPPHPQSNLFASRPATSREFCLRELARHMRQLVTADSVLSGDRATEIQRRVRHLGSASKGRVARVSPVALR